MVNAIDSRFDAKLFIICIITDANDRISRVLRFFFWPKEAPFGHNIVRNLSRGLNLKKLKRSSWLDESTGA